MRNFIRSVIVPFIREVSKPPVNGPGFTNATIVGTAIGDSLGMPFEMKKPTFPPLMAWNGNYSDSIASKWHNLKSGQWTDDTQMSIYLTESLVRMNGFDPDDVAKSYLAWFESGDCRGMGGTTRDALTKVKNGASWKESGMTGEKIGGNGTAMRAAPIGIFYRNDLNKVIEVVSTDAIITHNVPEAIAGSIAIAVANALLVTRQAEPKNIIDAVLPFIPPSAVRQHIVVAKRILAEDLDGEAGLRILGTMGYVVETVAAALYCVSKYTTYQNTVIAAVKGGGDADTTAAIAGAMAGSYYGLEGIPEKYRKGVEAFDMLRVLDDKLFHGTP